MTVDEKARLQGARSPDMPSRLGGQVDAHAHPGTTDKRGRGQGGRRWRQPSASAANALKWSNSRRLIKRLAAIWGLSILLGCESTGPPPASPSAAEAAAAGQTRRQTQDAQAAQAQRQLGQAEAHIAAGAWQEGLAALRAPAVLAQLAQASVPQDFSERLWRLAGAMPWAQTKRLATLPSDADGSQGLGAKRLAAIWPLRAAMDQALSTSDQAMRFQAWRGQWPAHPFASRPPDSLLRLLQRPPAPRRVALLTPLSGPLAQAGQAVRDGFISAYLQDPAAAKPEVLLYDTAAADIATLLTRSRTDGAAFIVGPLARLEVQSLRNLQPKAPVLGLNYPEAGTHASFRALGLAIEDDAATIAQRLRNEGHRRVLIIRNAQNWAARGANALAEAWPHHLEQQTFTDIKALPESVGVAVGVAASEQRHARMERLLGTELKFVPRPRADLDAIVAFVDHLQARALAPALRFHFVAGLPVYASSQSTRSLQGNGVAAGIADLEGFRVAQLPFQLDRGLLREALSQVFKPQTANQTALFALGLDAYRLFDHWPLLRAGTVLQGATGMLHVGSDGRIGRTLAWAEVVNGQLQAHTGAAVQK